MRSPKTKKAHEVLKTLMTGPAHLTDEQRAGYNLWLSTWVVPQLAELIPQLGEKLEYRYATSETQAPIIHGYTCIPASCTYCHYHPKGATSVPVDPVTNENLEELETVAPVAPETTGTISLPAQTITVHGTQYVETEPSVIAIHKANNAINYLRSLYSVMPTGPARQGVLSAINLIDRAQWHIDGLKVNPSQHADIMYPIVHPTGKCEPVNSEAFAKGAYTWCRFCGKEMEK